MADKGFPHTTGQSCSLSEYGVTYDCPHCGTINVYGVGAIQNNVLSVLCRSCQHMTALFYSNGPNNGINYLDT